MKYLTSLAVLAVCVIVSNPVFADRYGGGCLKKEQELMKQLDYAKRYNNHGRIQGLERALEKVRTWCSDSGLLTKAEERIKDKREEVREREEELAEALAEEKGADKIAKRKRKLEEAKNELNQAIQERDSLLASVTPEEK